jgi:hypothetical protein
MNVLKNIHGKISHPQFNVDECIEEHSWEDFT